MDRGTGEGLRSVMKAFGDGADRVLLRGAAGEALDAILADFVMERSRTGRVLVLAPHAIRETYGARLRARHPTLSVGAWEADAAVEVAAPMHAGVRAASRLPGTFDWIVVEECHHANAGMIQAVVTQFAQARVLEAIRQPGSVSGNLAQDAEVVLR